jgi:PPK2 family polyphosphate:nucleotide phosphotransferase
MNYTKRFQVKPGARFSLARLDPGDTAGITSKVRAKRLLEHGIARLDDAQERLYAQNTWAVLLIFQAMDGAGKDGTIEHVMSGVNPQGVQVFSFKAPSPEELDHDYLWRAVKALPERGRIGIHNRSHYEEVVIARVHPEILERQQLPPETRGPGLWARRYREIRHWERYLHDNGTLVLKFFLHVSKDEQRRRFLKRLDEPEKHWKFSPADVRERAHWDRYMAAYEDAIRNTSTSRAPWFVVPADHKWFTRLAVAEIIGDALDGLGLRYPTVPKNRLIEWAALRAELSAEAADVARPRGRRAR